MTERREFSEDEKTGGTAVLYGLVLVASLVVWWLVSFRAGAVTFVVLGCLAAVIASVGSRGQTSKDE